MLALELEATEAEPATIDMDSLVVAAYLHDISTVAHGFQDHQRKSAEMALAFLQPFSLSREQRSCVEQTLLAHTMAMPPEQRESTPIEAKILFDADKLGRLSGLAVVTSLIEFGARYPNREVTGDVLADARVVRLGRTMSFGRVTLLGATDNKPVAMVSSAFAMLNA